LTDDVREKRIAASWRQIGVELQPHFHEPRNFRAIVNQRSLFVAVPLKQPDAVGCDSLCRQPGRNRFDCAPRLDQFLWRCVQGRPINTPDTHGTATNEGSITMPNLNCTDEFERKESLARRRTRDSILSGDLGVRWKPFAGQILPTADRGEEILSDGKIATLPSRLIRCLHTGDCTRLNNGQQDVKRLKKQGREQRRNA
jgi:hypothetical protein